MYFYKAMKEKQISCSEYCFVNSCASFRKKKKNLIGGCSGFSILRGTLKLPKGFSRVVPLCQKYLYCQKAVSQLRKNVAMKFFEEGQERMTK